jgi:antitoxin HicB
MTKNNQLERQPLEYYLSLKHPISIYPEEEGYTVMIPDLRGCITQGETLEECINIILKKQENFGLKRYMLAPKKIFLLHQKELRSLCELFVNYIKSAI